MRILIIEDNPDLATNLGEFLENGGHTVDYAGDGVAGGLPLPGPRFAAYWTP